MNNNYYAVIMAGGIGSRFWPMSRTKHPKQFIDVLGTGKTLIQQTFNRLTKICPAENIYIVTNDIYKELVLEQISVNSEQVLCEPAMKNTAPCIAYAAFKIHQKNPNASMLVAPSDHLILKEDEFVSCIKQSLNATENNDVLITLGIKPSRPDTGYGYIQYKNEHLSSDTELKEVKTFTEKPNLELAEQFIASGDFLWNSGIFIWSAESIINRFQKDLKEIYDAFTASKHLLNTDKETEFINTTYPALKSISIDFGIMEKADNVFVLPSDFGWSDLGTFGSIYSHIPKDENENALVSDNVILYNASKNMIHSNADKLIVVDGLEDYIVVDRENVLLICKKENEQLIKQYMKDAKEQKGEDYV
jgi:mannose-1-phosphate guanylyltransferase